MGRAPCNVKGGLKKGPWTPEEDHKLLSYIHDHGPKNWLSLPTNAGLERCGKSCRLRWTNYLRPDIKRGRFSFEEEETIIQLHSILGNKWSAIAARLPGRTDNEIKNYWNTRIRKRLLQMGIDPVTHIRRLDLLDLSSILTSPLLNLSSFQNPQFLQLATTLFALNHQNPDLLLQQNQLYNPQMQNQTLMTQQVPSHCTTFDNDISNLDQTQFMQANVLEGFASNSMQDSYYIYGGSSPTDMCDQLGYSSFESLSNGCNDQDSSFGCVSLLDVKPLNSPSTFISTSTDQDEKESYCRSSLKLEFHENLDMVSEFM